LFTEVPFQQTLLFGVENRSELQMESGSLPKKFLDEPMFLTMTLNENFLWIFVGNSSSRRLLLRSVVVSVTSPPSETATPGVAGSVVTPAIGYPHFVITCYQ